MPKTAKVTFAGREYLIAQKNNGPASVWREHLNRSQVMLIFRDLDPVLTQITAIIDRAFELVDVTDDEGKLVKQMRGFGDLRTDQMVNLGRFIPGIVNGLSHSIDEMVDMVFDYCPEMKADREWIEENAYDEELVSAFVEVLKISFPFLEAWALVRGGKATPISTNSPTPNGASGRKALARQKTT
jgi:hypothetical protein